MNKFMIYRQQIYTLLENFGCAKTTSQRDNETTRQRILASLCYAKTTRQLVNETARGAVAVLWSRSLVVS